MEAFLRELVTVASYQWLGKNILAGLEAELTKLQRKGKIFLSDGIIQLLRCPTFGAMSADCPIAVLGGNTPQRQAEERHSYNLLVNQQYLVGEIGPNYQKNLQLS